jgi:hypothetical protein
MAVPLTSHSSQYPLSQGPRPFERPRQQGFNKEAVLTTLQQYKKAPINADLYLDPKTQQRRDRIWQSWLRCGAAFPYYFRSIPILNEDYYLASHKIWT